jgi:hypothetical protein
MLSIRDTHQIKRQAGWKGWEKIFHTQNNSKKAEVAVLSDKIGFKIRNITGDQRNISQ